MGHLSNQKKILTYGTISQLFEEGPMQLIPAGSDILLNFKSQFYMNNLALTYVYLES